MEQKFVHLSSDALRGILLEKSRHPGTECMVAMPGVRKGNDFYFDMVADSGIHATYEYAWCEKDHKYVSHLSNRISEYYDIPISFQFPEASGVGTLTFSIQSQTRHLHISDFGAWG